MNLQGLGEALSNKVTNLWNVFILVVLMIIISEMCIMLLFQGYYSTLNTYEFAAIDAVLLGFIITPLLYLLIIKPARNQIINEQKLYFEMYDRLTGLPTSALFQDIISHEINIVNRDGGFLGVFIINPARVSDINQALGFQVGDDLLAQMADRLIEVTRKSDVISRLSGIEFGLMIKVQNLPELKTVETKIKSALEAPYGLHDTSVIISTHMGISIFPTISNSAITLLSQASLALSKAKQEKIPSVVFDGAIETNAIRKIESFGMLKKAIEESTFELHYQPQVSSISGNVVGVEALIRMTGDDKMFPDEFIPIAEQTGLINEITAWVFNDAVKQIKKWNELGLSIPVSINFSTRNLHDHELIECLMEKTRELDVDSSLITIEVTESAIMNHPENAIRTLHMFRDRGFKVSIDDFGTGYSSLSYLKKIPANELKLDRSFINQILEDKHDSMLVESIIQLAKGFGMETVAEGVESVDVIDKLKLMGCDVLQGYFFSKPMNAEQYIEWHTQQTQMT